MRRGNTTEYYQVLRAAYGLVQAPKLWNKMLNEWMLSQDFCVSDWDPCLYYRSHDNLRVIYWVDDGLIQGPQASVDAFKSAVFNTFKVTLGGPATWFLSMEVVRDRSNRTVLLKQPQKIAEILHYFWYD